MRRELRLGAIDLRRLRDLRRDQRFLRLRRAGHRRLHVLLRAVVGDLREVGRQVLRRDVLPRALERRRLEPPAGHQDVGLLIGEILEDVPVGVLDVEQVRP